MNNATNGYDGPLGKVELDSALNLWRVFYPFDASWAFFASTLKSGIEALAARAESTGITQ